MYRTLSSLDYRNPPSSPPCKCWYTCTCTLSTDTGVHIGKLVQETKYIASKFNIKYSWEYSILFCKVVYQSTQCLNFFLVLAQHWSDFPTEAGRNSERTVQLFVGESTSSRHHPTGGTSRYVHVGPECMPTICTT